MYLRSLNMLPELLTNSDNSLLHGLKIIGRVVDKYMGSLELIIKYHSLHLC